MCKEKQMSYEETLDATKDELFDENDSLFKDAKELTLGDFDASPEDDAALDEIDFDELLEDKAEEE